MSRPKLTSDQKRVLRQSAREEVQSSLGRLVPYMRRYARWLTNNNIYRQGQPTQPINQKHLREYIAASAPLHCADGWSFLGRALDCHAQGDSNSARHLGYYAELRGAMSLLAAEGIGIFATRHAIVGSAGSCETLPTPRSTWWFRGTHRMTWLALKHWSGLQRSADLLGTAIQPAGISLHEWVEAYPAARARWHAIGDRWLRTWGLDLQRVADDREARNEASYRPTHVSPDRFLPVAERSSFMRDFWRVHEPSPASRFELLDRHLLRLTLEQGFRASTGSEPRNDRSRFRQGVVAMLDVVAPSGMPLKQWRRFLMRDEEPDDSPVISEARGTLGPHDARHHVQVIGRAALLLRVATGACALLIRAAGLDRAELEFWCNCLGHERGLWDEGQEPDQLLDLWADIQAALDEVYDWEVDVGGNSGSFMGWRRDCAHGISVLAQCERIGLWGLGL